MLETLSTQSVRGHCVATSVTEVLPSHVQAVASLCCCLRALHVPTTRFKLDVELEIVRRGYRHIEKELNELRVGSAEEIARLKEALAEWTSEAEKYRAKYAEAVKMAEDAIPVTANKAVQVRFGGVHAGVQTEVWEGMRRRSGPPPRVDLTLPRGAYFYMPYHAEPFVRPSSAGSTGSGTHSNNNNNNNNNYNNLNLDAVQRLEIATADDDSRRPASARTLTLGSARRPGSARGGRGGNSRSPPPRRARSPLRRPPSARSRASSRGVSPSPSPGSPASSQAPHHRHHHHHHHHHHVPLSARSRTRPGSASSTGGGGGGGGTGPVPMLFTGRQQVRTVAAAPAPAVIPTVAVVRRSSDTGLDVIEDTAPGVVELEVWDHLGRHDDAFIGSGAGFETRPASGRSESFRAATLRAVAEHAHSAPNLLATTTPRRLPSLPAPGDGSEVARGTPHHGGVAAAATSRSTSTSTSTKPLQRQHQPPHHFASQPVLRVGGSYPTAAAGGAGPETDLRARGAYARHGAGGAQHGAATRAWGVHTTPNSSNSARSATGAATGRSRGTSEPHHERGSGAYGSARPPRDLDVATSRVHSAASMKVPLHKRRRKPHPSIRAKAKHSGVHHEVAAL